MRQATKNIIWSNGHQLHFNNIVGSDNCFLYDSEGRKLIDLESGVWCTCLGHNNKRINSAIVAQINSITHTGFCYCNPQIDEAAKLVLDISGIENGKCEFLSSGSEAIEFGMRAARSATAKPLALTFSDSYFGAYGDAAMKDKSNWHIYNWLDCSCENPENGCIGECDSFRSIPFEKIGIFLFEPGSSSGLVRFPSKALIAKIYDNIKQDNGIVMVNEVTTGMGRTEKWFGFQHYNFIPDIVAIGKGIGNGYPVSLVVVSQNVADRLKESAFKYSQSHQNDPLGARIVKEVIDIIHDDGLLEKCCDKGSYLIEKLLELRTESSLVKEVRGRGLMIAIELKKNAQVIYEVLLKQGVIVAKRPNSEVLRLDPALTVEKSTLDIFLKILKNLVLE
ncbi:MAG: aminotransferase class III-fold pyridoxal phosphate-dependent enzyme [Bacteroidales bacterium]|nr:aminotransferase class III-fold pyridoxal phosphate-dependent enzyme [Bacteroidales bacterium]